MRICPCHRPDGFSANTDRAGASRRRVRQREELNLYPAATRRPERNLGQARKKTWRIRGVRAQMRRQFPRRIYRRRALIESLFSSVKRKLSARAPGRTLPMQKRQALWLGLSFNLYRLWHPYPTFLRGMSTEPGTSWSNAHEPAVRLYCAGLLLSVLAASSRACRSATFFCSSDISCCLASIWSCSSFKAAAPSLSEE